MKRLALLLILIAGAALSAAAQGEQDFAARFAAIYGKTYNLRQRTISPQMMDRILQLDNVEHDDRRAGVVAQLKSIRILTGGKNTAEAGALFAKAEDLAERNRRRYDLHTQADSYSVYTRHHGRRLVELVVISVKDARTFMLIDLTGNMNDDIIDQIRRI